MRRLWNQLTQLYDRHPEWMATIAGTGFLLALIAVHAAMSFTSAFRVLYVLPIWLATRLGGKISGFALVLLSTLAGTLTEWEIGHGANETMGSNLLLRFIALSALMLLIWNVEKALQKHQRLA